MKPQTDEIFIPDATLEPAAYKAALLRLSETDDVNSLIERLTKTPKAVAALIEAAGAEAANLQPASGEWTAAQTVGHLFDVDVVYGFRWRLVATEENPSYPGYNEKEWTFLPKPPLPELLQTWQGLREANATLIRAVPNADWSRRGSHGEQGGETFEEMVRKVVGHDLAHVNQIQRTLQVVAPAD